ncbi:hypothetical protein Agub_g8569, partial [Astrephomene gubernaculifera]
PTPGLHGQTWAGQLGTSSISISTPQQQAQVTTAAAYNQATQRAAELERELGSVRAKLEQQQLDGQALASQMESLKNELAAERSRREDLERQLHATSTAHQSLQTDHDRLLAELAAALRDRDLLTSSRAATLRELEDRHAEVTRLQRQLEQARAAAEASAAVAAAAGAGAQGGEGAGGHCAAGSAVEGATAARGQRGVGKVSPRSMGSAVAPMRYGSAGSGSRLGPGGGGSASCLSAAAAAEEEERWALRLHKAERALEEERRVSEDLRGQLAAAAAEAREGRAALQRLRQLECELEDRTDGAAATTTAAAAATSPAAADGSSSRGGRPSSLMTSTLSEPLPLSSPVACNRLQPLYGNGLGGNSLQPPAFYHASSAAAASGAAGGSGLTGMASAPPGGSMGAAGPAVGAAGWGAAGGMRGSGGGGGGSSGSGSGVGAGGVGGCRLEEQVARLKREVDLLRGELHRAAAAEESHRVALRAAEDRCRAAELVGLDARRQCERAAGTIERLIEENSELAGRLNAQANAMAENRVAAARKDAALRALEARLAAVVEAPGGGAPPRSCEQAAASATATAASRQTQTQAQPQPQPHSSHHQQPHPGLSQNEFLESRTGAAGTATSGSALAVTRGSVSADPPSRARVEEEEEEATTTPLQGSQQATMQQAGRSVSVSVSGGGGGGGASGDAALLLGGSLLSEADWKLVMLAEEVRRLVREVALASTACAAMQVRSQQLQNHHNRHNRQQPHVNHHDASSQAHPCPTRGDLSAAAIRGHPSSSSSSQPTATSSTTPTSTTTVPVAGSAAAAAAPPPPPDLPRILSRLEGLSGRRLGAGETAAYILELAGHMEALEELLGELQRSMEEGEEGREAAGRGAEAAAAAVGG